jgi:hypothetical protein
LSCELANLQLALGIFRLHAAQEMAFDSRHIELPAGMLTESGEL